MSNWISVPDDFPKWIKTSEYGPEEYIDGEQVFTLPVTLSEGQPDLAYTRHVGDDPDRYPYWMPVHDVLSLLKEFHCILCRELEDEEEK